jgi:uncharacterized protein (TIGR02996 family)
VTTTIATEAGFMADICANPADDVVRLIYADFLEERGGPGDADRAEFIRGQIQLAKMIEPLGSGRNMVGNLCVACSKLDIGRCLYHALETRHADLLAVNVVFWQPDGQPAGWDLFPDGQFIPLVDDRGNITGFRSAPDRPVVCMGLSFCRGFLSSAICPAEDWVCYGDAIRGCQPIERVRFTTYPDVTVETYGNPVGGIDVLDPRGIKEPVRIPMGDLAPGQHFVLVAMERWWPGVTFGLPPEIPITANWGNAHGATPLSDFRRLMRDMDIENRRAW